MAEDADFADMGNGKETHGREAVRQLLHYMYHVAFDARAEITNEVFTENKASMEFNFSGNILVNLPAYSQPTKK